MTPMPRPAQPDRSVWSVFFIFLRLGLTSFGGPVAHLSYFRDEFVHRRHWLSDESYASLVAFCQFLPGPTSSQVGIALGLRRLGYAGAFAAWAGFTLPSATLLTLFALTLSTHGELIPSEVLHSLKVVVVSVVAHAVWSMTRALCTDVLRISMMMFAAAFVLLIPTVWTPILVLVLAAVIGLLLLRPEAKPIATAESLPITHRAALRWMLLFFILLIGLPLVSAWYEGPVLATIDAFYRVGSLVFGGGHVVLPLLQSEMEHLGWVNHDVFAAGYGVAQAMPGPLFSFAAFLGASIGQTAISWLQGLIALFAIFAPSFLLLFGALPFWDALSHNARMRAALSGVNAAVVGLLLAALYQPIWVNAIYQPHDFVLALLAFLALARWKLPPWLVVSACVVIGVVRSLVW